MKLTMAKKRRQKKRLLVICQGSLECVGTLTRVLAQIEVLKVCPGVELHVVWLLPSTYRRDPSRKRWLESVRQDWTFPNRVLYSPPLGSLMWFPSACFRLISLAWYIVRHKIEAVQAHSIGGMHGVLLRLGRILGVQTLLDMQGAYPEETAYGGANGKTVRRLDALERKIVKVCNSVYCVSNKMVEHIVSKHHVTPAKFAIIPCCVRKKLVGVDPDRRRHVRRSLGLDEKFVLVYSGGTAPYQCIPEMCALFSGLARRLPDVVWLVLSWGDLTLFRRSLDSLGVDPGRYSLKRLDQSEVHDHLVSADVGLLLRENHILNRVSSPTKFAEYLAAGLPVVTTPYVGDVADIVTREDVGAVINLPPAEEIETLLAFLGKVQAHREGYARRCLEYVEREWTWESRQERFLQPLGVGN